MSESASPRAAETAFALLEHPLRIDVVPVLRRIDPPTSTASLAARLGGDGADPETLAVSLHHTHLPKLSDAGVLAYDPVDRTILAVDTDRLDELLAAGADVLSSLRTA